MLARLELGQVKAGPRAKEGARKAIKLDVSSIRSSDER